MLTRVCWCTPPGNRSQRQARPRDRHRLTEGAFPAQVPLWGQETCSWGWTPSPEPSPASLPAGLGGLLHRELTLAVPGLHRPGWGPGAQVMLCPSSGGSLGSQGPGGAGKVGGGDHREGTSAGRAGLSRECRWERPHPAAGRPGIWCRPRWEVTPRGRLPGSSVTSVPSGAAWPEGAGAKFRSFRPEPLSFPSAPCT